MELSPRDLLRGFVEVSSLPTIHIKLEEAINDPKKSMSDIARVIRDDAGLTARLLRIVNSAFYSFPSRIETISQAVTIVGTQQLSALALATSVMRMFKGIPHSLVTMDSFWRHGIGVGLAARAIATYRREGNPERFFVAGILHDIGRLILYTKIPDVSKEMLTQARTREQLLYDQERETIGFTHAVVGGVLLQTWKLPGSLEEIVMFHHNPRGAVRFPADTATVHLADIIAHAMQLGSSGEQYVPPLDAEAWDSLDIPPSALSAIVDQVDREYQDAIRTMLTDA